MMEKKKEHNYKNLMLDLFSDHKPVKRKQSGSKITSVNTYREKWLDPEWNR